MSAPLDEVLSVLDKAANIKGKDLKRARMNKIFTPESTDINWQVETEVVTQKDMREPYFLEF
jgi:hypothetical protein